MHMHKTKQARKVISPKPKKSGLSPTNKKYLSNNNVVNKSEKQQQEKQTAARANHKKKVSLNDVIMSQTQTMGNMSTFFSNGASQTQTADLYSEKLGH